VSPGPSSAAQHHRRSGFTLLELLIGLGLFAVLSVNITLLTRATQRIGDSEDQDAQLAVLAEQTMDRIRFALMAARQEAIQPLNVAPLHDKNIRYQISLGVDENGDMNFGELEQIGLEQDKNQVVWLRDPGQPGQLRVVWGNHVALAALGEDLDNVTDDNGNGLVDEFGLSFHLAEDGMSVMIELTLARETSAGQMVSRRFTSKVAFRN
jgi:prepilin-type N-terminal cleavage/methylation domain-containing protein